jgi:hypothetical protein
MKKLLIILFALTSLGLDAQEKKRVTNVPGEAQVADDISVVQARERAIQAAKIEAMRIAGVPEYVSEVTVFQKSEKDVDNFTEVFNSIANQEVSGEIASFQVIREEKVTNAAGNFVVKVWLDAEVMIHQRHSDPSFYAAFHGIHENYSSPQNLTFQFKPSNAGFLQVFIIDEKESTVLYPNSLERSELFEGNRAYQFPLSKSLDYEVSTVNNIEVNYVLMLFTKKEFSYTEGNTVSELLSFVSRISPDEKFVKIFPIVIKKNQ